MNWKEFEGKKVYLRLKNGRIYSGKVKAIDNTSKTMIFIYLIDKYSKEVIIVHSEILELREEA